MSIKLGNRLVESEATLISKMVKSIKKCRSKVIEKELNKFNEKTLYSKGKRVAKRKQALAIALRAADFECTPVSIRKRYSPSNLRSMTIKEIRETFSKLRIPSKLSKQDLVLFVSQRLYKLQ